MFFSGLTPESSATESLLKSLCEQIMDVYNIKAPIPQEYSELATYFIKLLNVSTLHFKLYVRMTYYSVSYICLNNMFHIFKEVSVLFYTLHNNCVFIFLR